MKLPKPQVEKLPTFQSQKQGVSQYGSGNDLIESEKRKAANKFFRRGITGSYKDEMPKLLQLLYWLKNRKQMNIFKYYKNK